jgi:hypothetical protein
MKTLSTINLNPLRKIILPIIFLISINSFSQSKIDSLLNKINPEKFSATIEKKVNKLEDKIIAKTGKTLHRLQKQEEKIYRKELSTKDSLVAKAKLAEIQSKYKELEDKLKNPTAIAPNNIKQYIPHLDSLSTSLKFLNQQGISGNVTNALARVQSLEGKMQQAEEIKKFIRERKEQLKKQLEQLGLVKELKKYNKEVFYYSEQLKEYKSILNDPDKIEKKALALLSKTKIFQDFMKKNSMLASLFRMPGDPNDPSYLASLSGLQTRAQISSLIQQQVAGGGPNAQAQFRQNLQQAQAQLQQLKNSVAKYGSGSSDDILPEGFKPNNQKSKSFLKRLEYGTNFQTQRSTSFFPVTSDIGLSLGYKLNDKSVIGIGASYKLGWGQNFRNIHLSSQGAGLRSYIDWKLKGSFWVSGGYEMNYKTAFNSFYQLQDLNAWQQSGLLGLSKVLAVKTKFFKKTKLQLLWDFLSYQQIPRTQPIVFRVGYNLK